MLSCVWKLTQRVLSFLSTTLTENRGRTSYVTDDPEAESTVLVIMEEDAGYALRIYNYQGHLVADYGESAGQLWPQDAIKLGENTRFEITEVKPGLLMIDTSDGRLFVAAEGYQGVR